MHKKLIEEASDIQLRDFIDDALSMIKETHEDLYEDLEMYLYKEIYGKHFNNWMLEKAVKSMVNEDGTTGPHWTVEQTTSVAKQMGIVFDSFNNLVRYLFTFIYFPKAIFKKFKL